LFSSSLPPSSPLSFPTRRSSDLDLHSFGPEQRVGSVQGRMHRSIEGFVKLIKLSFLDLLPASVTAICALAVVASRNRPLTALMADRKSTRLNSSHVAISYAVFCL